MLCDSSHRARHCGRDSRPSHGVAPLDSDNRRGHEAAWICIDVKDNVCIGLEKAESESCDLKEIRILHVSCFSVNDI